MNVKQVDKVTF